MSEITLSGYIKTWRADRPDEWTMDEFIRKAEKLERELQEARELYKSYRSLVVELMGYLGPIDYNKFEKILDEIEKGEE
jgi:hypothetical protein